MPRKDDVCFFKGFHENARRDIESAKRESVRNDAFEGDQ